MQGTPKREIFHVAGDAPDPTGGAARGLAPGYDLTATAAGHPLLFYRLPNDHELILEADVYQLPDVAMHIHLICPLCMMAGRTVGLTITQGNKEMQFERQVADTGNALSTFEAIAGDLEADPFYDLRKDRHRPVRVHSKIHHPSRSLNVY